MRQHPAILCVGLVASIALLAAARDAQAQDKVVKNGGLFAMSGPGSYFGVQDKQGIELAIEQLNKTSIKVTDPGNPWTFRIMPNEVMQGVDIATNAYKRLNARTAVLLYENTNAGIGNAKVFNDTFTKLGGKILADIGFGRDVNDFTAIATRIAGLGKVDVIP